MELAGKVAVITGGASGIGLATAKQLAARGTEIVLVDIEEHALRQAMQTITSDFPVRVETRQCDVSDYTAMTALAEDVVAAMGAVNIIFNNAGIAVGGPVADMRHEDWRWTIDVDLWGPIHGVEVFLPHIRAAGEGHVLFTASFAGLVPNVGLGPYCVAKYGVVALAEVLHKEMRNEGIGVSVLCPMRVATNIGNSGRNRQAQYGEDSLTSLVPDQSEVNQDLAGIVMNVEEVAAQVLAAIDNNRLYILPHEESRPFIQRRFQRIEDAFMD